MKYNHTYIHFNFCALDHYWGIDLIFSEFLCAKVTDMAYVSLNCFLMFGSNNKHFVL